jgi:hypothetical protein
MTIRYQYPFNMNKYDFECNPFCWLYDPVPDELAEALFIILSYGYDNIVDLYSSFGNGCNFGQSDNT